jgi:lipopolysaccharide transport system permease protein
MESVEKNPRRGRLFQHRDLLIGFTVRHIQRQTKGSWLGLLWIFLNPLLMMMVYSVVFGMIMGGQFGMTENPGPFEYPLGIFIGLTVLGQLTESMTQSPGLILSYRNLVEKVVFPLHILPLAQVGSIFFKTLISALMALAGVLVFSNSVSWEFLWFPLILLPLLLISIGIGYLLAALGVYFRDLQQLMAVVGTILFYSSAVFYPVNRIPPELYAWLKFNPVLQAVELSRDVLLWNIPMDPVRLLYLYGVGIVSIIVGFWSFQRLRSGFADVL